MALNKTLLGLLLPRVQGGTSDPKLTESPPHTLSIHPCSQLSAAGHRQDLFPFLY